MKQLAIALAIVAGIGISAGGGYLYAIKHPAPVVGAQAFNVTKEGDVYVSGRKVDETDAERKACADWVAALGAQQAAVEAAKKGKIHH